MKTSKNQTFIKIRRIVEFFGKHPFATGLFALLGIVGFILTVGGYNLDRKESQQTTEQVKEVSEQIKKIDDKIELRSEKYRDMRPLKQIPEGFSKFLTFNMNPGLIIEELGPPFKIRKSLEVKFYDKPEIMECWLYKYDDILLEFFVAEDQLIAYTFEVFPEGRLYELDLFFGNITLGETTMGEAGEGGKRSYFVFEYFGNFRNPVFQSRYVYDGMRNQGGTAFFGTSDTGQHDYFGFDDWGDGVKNDIKESWTDDIIIHSVTVSRGIVESDYFGYVFSL